MDLKAAFMLFYAMYLYIYSYAICSIYMHSDNTNNGEWTMVECGQWAEDIEDIGQCTLIKPSVRVLLFLTHIFACFSSCVCVVLGVLCLDKKHIKKNCI